MSDEFIVPDFMTAPVTSLPCQASLLDAAATILRVKKIGCLPVVQDGRLVGIITVNDILRALRRLLAGARAQKSPVGDS